MNNKALIIVDMQADFLPGGVLAVPGADEIIQPIFDYAVGMHKQEGIVIATRDYHPADHVSFSDDPEHKDYSWPPHCVQGTPGVKIDKQIKKVTDFLVSKGDEPGDHFDAYSAFSGHTLRPKMPLLDLLLEHHIDSIEIVGVAFDKCVGHTALDANALGYRTTVLTEMTRAISAEGFGRMGDQLERAGVVL